jgi:hypothetical protein
MQVIGILKHVSDTQKVSDKFSKREFVITTDATTPYPQHVSFQLTQDKCNLLNDLHKFPIGAEIKVDFNLRGREWNGPQGIKYFNTLEAWRLESINSNPQTSAPSPATDDNDGLPY